MLLVHGNFAALLHDIMEDAKVLCGMLVVTKGAGFLIEGNLLPEPVGVIHEVPHNASIVGVHDISIGHFGLIFPARGNKTVPASTGSHVATGKLDLLPLVTSGFKIVRVRVGHDAPTIFKVILVLNLPLVAIVIHVPDIEEAILPVGILGDSEHGVRGLSLIIPLKAAANGHGPHGVGLVIVDGPARYVQLVSSLIVEIAVARLPEPVPIIVDIVCMVVVDDCRALPGVPVQIFWRGSDALGSNSSPGLAAVTVGDLQFPPSARLDHFVEGSDVLVAATLCSMLDHDAVFILGCYRDPALFDVMAHGLLDVDMLASLSCPDCHE